MTWKGRQRKGKGEAASFGAPIPMRSSSLFTQELFVLVLLGELIYLRNCCDLFIIRRNCIATAMSCPIKDYPIIPHGYEVICNNFIFGNVKFNYIFLNSNKKKWKSINFKLLNFKLLFEINKCLYFDNMVFINTDM